MIGTSDLNALFSANANNGDLAELRSIAIGADASAVNLGKMYSVSSGTNDVGVAYLSTKKHLLNTPGRTSGCIISAIFSEGLVDTLQFAGLLGAEDRLGFGYLNLEFGLMHDRNGRVGAYTITITTPASASESANVVINDRVFSIPLTNATAEVNAAEIANFLSTNDPNHDFESIDNVVRLTSRFDGILTGAFSFASNTAAATVVETNVGVYRTRTFVKRSEFNLNTLTNLEPTSGNLYRIQTQNMGFGAIIYSVYYNSEWVDVHRIDTNNMGDELLTSETNLSIGVWASNTTGTSHGIIVDPPDDATSVTVQCHSMMGFMHGDPPGGILKSSSPTIGFSGSVTDEQTLLTLRNPIILPTGELNRSDVLIKRIRVTNNTNKIVTFRVYDEFITAGDILWEPPDTLSAIQFTKQNQQLSSGEKIMMVALLKTTVQVIELPVRMTPGSIFTVTAKLEDSAASPSETRVVVEWEDDR